VDNLHPARLVLDRIDAKILTELQQDATLPIAVLADRVGLSTSPCWKRVQKLEKAGVLLGRVARVNAAKVGLGLTVLVEIEAADHTLDWRSRFMATVETMPEVIEVLRLGGPPDYLLRVVVPDTQSFDGVYQRLVAGVMLRAVTSKFVMEVAHQKLGLPIRIT